ncbi:formyltransferase family protein [Parasphingorhabdus sp.]|uniref:formyltransferase family protein n=1 Tax=Parasphingorhabdus sp. TaxID=2709688 RepID=UPI003A91D9F0
MNTDTWPVSKTVSVVVDTAGWFDPFAQRLVKDLISSGHQAALIRDYDDVPAGNVAFYLSCMRITPLEILARNERNLVVHASDLPKGRGFSPIVWQVLEGADEIPVTMIYMAEEVDAGEIVLQDTIYLEGHELNDEMRDLLGNKIVEMCLDYTNSADLPESRPQSGESSWYPRRRPNDSQLDPHQSLAAQFELLRVVDNERYPAFFDYRGFRYTLRIDKQGAIPTSETKG